MPKERSVQELLLRIQELENRVEESEQLIDAIKAGEVDAFAIKNQGSSDIYTLQTGDYAYRVLIEEFGEGAVNVSEEGLIVYTNSYFLELLQIPYEKVIGASIFDFVHPNSKKEFQQLFKKALSGKSKGEIYLQNAEAFPVYISLTSLQPKLPTIGIIVTDLTQKKKNEKMILEYQRNLETKNQMLVKSNDELASFAYIASHDLQEPLRKIQTFATRLVEKEFATLSEKGKDYFARMQVAAKRMQTLIEDLLTYSRTNTVEKNFENIDLKKLVEGVRADLSEELQDKKAVIDAAELGNAKIIPFQFRQLLHNLISNSLKFSQPAYPPEIKIKSEIVQGEEMDDTRLSVNKKYCHISFSDNGIGFEQQYSEKIFDLFQRLHGNSTYKGTGIGLAIVKKIVENHNGVISAKSEINRGTTFNIYIPAA